MTINLVTLPDGHLLAAAPAASYTRMSAAYGSPLPVRSAYRTPAEQDALYYGWVHHLPGYAFALPAGTSVHELGYAVDFVDTVWLWLTLHAGPYGWYRTNPGEQWHYEYAASRDAHLTDAVVAPTPLTPVPPAPPHPIALEDDMKDYVIALYVNLLGRMPDATGLSGWLVDIGTGVETLASVELKLRGSDEYQKLDPTVRVQQRQALPIW